MSNHHELEGILKRWMRWYRFRRGFSWAGYGLAAGLGAAFALSLYGLLTARLLSNEYIALNFIAAAGSILAGWLAGYLWPLSRLQATRRYDLALGLKERMSTAIELAEDEKTGEIWKRLQLEDTLNSARSASARKGLPLKAPRWAVGLAALFALAAAAAFFIEQNSFVRAQEQRVVQAAITEQIEAIEALREEIESNESLTPEQRAELMQPLDEAIQKLQEADSKEDAVSILASTEEKLRTLENDQAPQKADALQNAGENMSETSGSPLESTGQSLAQGDYQNAAQELENLDLSSLSPDEQQALADQLDAAAETLQSTNPELAQQLSQAAEALRNGNIQAAQQALSQAGQSLTNAGQQINQAQAAQRAAGQVAQSQQQMLQAGQSQANAQQGQGQGQSQGQGQGQSQGQGQGQGSGSSQNQGEGGGGSGAGRGEGGGDAGPGSEVGADPIEQGNGAGDAGERGYEQIYASEHLGSTQGKDVNLPSEGGSPGDQVIGESGTSPGQEGASTVPYSQVYASYAEYARRAMDNPNLPPAFRALIRQYFSSLEP